MSPDIPRNSYRTPCADKNDKIGWTCGFSFRAGTSLVGFRSNNEEICAAARAELPFWCELCPETEVEQLLSVKVGAEPKRKGIKNYHLLYDSWTRIARTLDREDFWKAVLHSLRLKAIQGAGLTAHPGTVLSKDGKATLLVGAQVDLSKLRDDLMHSSGSTLLAEKDIFIDWDGRVWGDLDGKRGPEHTAEVQEILFVEPCESVLISAGEAALKLFASSFGHSESARLGFWGRTCFKAKCRRVDSRAY